MGFDDVQKGIDKRGKNCWFVLGGEGLESGDGPAQDEGVHVVGALVRVDGLQVHHVPDDVVLVRDTVAAEHLPRRPGDVDRLHAGVPLHHRDHLGGGLTGVLHAAEVQA